MLFVSHNMHAISTLTRKCIVLSRGLCTFAGETGPAIRHYLNDERSVESLYVDKPSPAPRTKGHPSRDSHPLSPTASKPTAGRWKSVSRSARPCRSEVRG